MAVTTPFNTWKPDESQQEVINISSGKHLVLAPPGCGKTQILAERIAIALVQGVKAEDMLCLTFTNRAARGMRERINDRVGDAETENVFVGNVHRFCSHFLFDNNIVPGDSAIIDEDTSNSILARYLNEDELKVANDFRRKKAYAQIIFFSHLMFEIEHGFPKALRIHPECVTREDISVMKAISKTVGKPFDAELMADIYNHADFYLDLVHQPSFAPLLRHNAEQTVAKMRFAHAYAAYKQQNNLLDFEDLLEYTYAYLCSHDDYKLYPWVQVDEVQDLNLLQLEIIKKISEPTGISVFFGDEQQAIFSFMGAKLATLNVLKEDCNGNLHHLNVNHRCPKELLDMLNTYAVANLGSDSVFLPKSGMADPSSGCFIKSYDNIWAEFKGVAKLASNFEKTIPDSTTAIIVNSNRDADEISNSLNAGGFPHFKISGTDIFSTQEVKLLFAHLNVLDNDQNFLAWSRLLNGMKVCETPASSRQFVHQLRKRAISPSDFLLGEDTYIQRFAEIYDNEDIVVFDTETTGLDVFNDDIIQIAAERIRQGKSIAKFSVYIETDRPIPAKLGAIVNPIIEERKHQHLYSHEEALQMFSDFAGDSILLAHNADFDRHILYYNICRYSGEQSQEERVVRLCQPLLYNGNTIDSLKLIRLLRPDLKAFKLKLLLKELGLEGENSHLADDDVNATVSLVNYCYKKAKEMLPSQNEYLRRKTTMDKVARLKRNYGSFYMNGINRLYERKQNANGTPALVEEIQTFYKSNLASHFIKIIDKLDYTLRFLTNDVIDVATEPTLVQQLENHIVEMNTFKEADLCGSSTITDRLFVSTIHKAKGLEFDNVIVFDVVDGRIPSFYNENNPAMMAEDARKLYVAMSRSKKRLYICYSKQGPASGMPNRKLSRFLTPVMKYFQ